MKITILQQSEYPVGDNNKGHYTFITNSEEGYKTAWGSFEYQDKYSIEYKRKLNILETFEYSYDNKTS